MDLSVAHALLPERGGHARGNARDADGPAVGKVFAQVHETQKNPVAQHPEAGRRIGLQVLHMQKIPAAFQARRQPGGRPEAQRGAHDDVKRRRLQPQHAPGRGQHKAHLVQDPPQRAGPRRHVLPAAVDRHAVALFAPVKPAVVARGFPPGGIIGKAGDHRYLQTAAGQEFREPCGVGSDSRWLRAVIDSPDDDVHALGPLGVYRPAGDPASVRIHGARRSGRAGVSERRCMPSL